MKKTAIALCLFFAGMLSLQAQSSEHNMKEWLPVERDAKTAVWTELDGVRIPIPPLEHPRLYVRTEDIPDLKQKMEHPMGKEILKKLARLPCPAVMRKRQL